VADNNHFKDDTLHKLLRDITTRQARIEVVVEEVRKDIKQHMVDTAKTKDTHREELDWLKRHIWAAHGAIALLGILAGLAKVGIIG
jgi:hypothetical protein